MRPSCVAQRSSHDAEAFGVNARRQQVVVAPLISAQTCRAVVRMVARTPRVQQFAAAGRYMAEMAEREAREIEERAASETAMPK